MDRDKALEAAVTQIERQFGKGAIMKLGDWQSLAQGPGDLTGAWDSTSRWASVDCPRADRRDLRPGVLGKTTVALRAIANAQAEGGVCRSSTRSMP